MLLASRLTNVSGTGLVFSVISHEKKRHGKKQDLEFLAPIEFADGSLIRLTLPLEVDEPKFHVGANELHAQSATHVHSFVARH